MINEAKQKNIVSNNLIFELGRFAMRTNVPNNGAILEANLNNTFKVGTSNLVLDPRQNMIET